MRHALIMAGGAGTRLWPMSRAALPKQLIPFIGGRSLLRLAMDRLEGLVPPDRCWVCAGACHRDPILAALPELDAARFLGEPTGRDTLNAVGFAAAVIQRDDPDAVIAVFTADHIIEPVGVFGQVVDSGLAIAESRPAALVTFGITPTHAATGYGYLQLGAPLDGGPARAVARFREKPDADTAAAYVREGPTRYLWNSGMFVWRAATLLSCIEKYEPATRAGLGRIAAVWGGPDAGSTLAGTYPALKKISVDFAVMEPASQDDGFEVVGVPMPLTWVDVGSWPAFAGTCAKDADANAIAAGRHLLLDTTGSLVASSDPGHLVTAIGCEQMIIVHTPDATLVCPMDRAEQIKALHEQVVARFGDERV